MILVLLAILVAIVPAFFLLRQSRIFYWYTGMILGWSLCVLAFLLFSAKNAGYNYYTNQLLFLWDPIRVHFLYSRVTPAQITAIQVVGRSLFLFFLLGFALWNSCRAACFRITAVLVNGVLGLLNILLYAPVFYRHNTMPDSTLYILSHLTRIWALTVILLSAFLLVQQYRRTTFQWFRIRLAYINYGILGITSFWAYVVLRGPIQYLEPRTFFYMYQSFRYYDPPLEPIEWLIWEIALVVVVVLSLHSFVQYSRYYQQLQNGNTRLNNTMMFSRNGVSMLGHAMKNHLISTGICLEDALADLQAGRTEPSVQLIRQTIQQNQAMLTRLNRLSAAVRQRELDLRPTRLRDILACALKDVDIPANIRLTTQLEDPDMTLMADIEALSESLRNILMNAVEAINTTEGHIQILQVVENSWCLIRISDDGPGMDKLQLEKIFDPFYSSKNSASNWGMGLSFAHQTIAAHGGILEASSQLRKGSVFTLALPASR